MPVTLTPDQIVQTAEKQISAYRTHPKIRLDLAPPHPTGGYFCLVDIDSRLRVRERAIEPFINSSRETDCRNACVKVAQMLVMSPKLLTSMQFPQQPNVQVPSVAVRGGKYVLCYAGDPSPVLCEVRMLALSVVIGDTARSRMEGHFQLNPNAYVTSDQDLDNLVLI